MPPTQSQPQSQPPTHHRSHNGCWTCKARRRKCDRARPTCRTCRERGVPCEGYEVRLRWGTGIASRGRFTGAGEPVVASVPVRVKGRRRDLSRERRMEGACGAVGEGDRVRSGSGMKREDENLFQEFLSSGIHMLHSTTVNDAGNLLASRLPELCRQSEALYAICLALQASFTSEPNPRFLEYFDAGLNQFRAELARSVARLEDGTFTAGLLLCSIGFVNGLPWTMHLRGIHSMLQLQGLDAHYRQQSQFRTHLLEVMGVMDLPSFAIGRQNPSLGVWRRYCRSRNRTDDTDDVEIVSGLPRSLLDIFSCIGEEQNGTTEKDFWDWPGAQGSLLQCQLWEAYRFAGILTTRHPQLHFSESSPAQAERVSPSRLRAPPSTRVLVLRIFSCLDAITRESSEPDGEDSLVVNAIPYPVFVAGLQTDILNENPGLKEIVRRCFALRRSRAKAGREYQVLLDLLEEWWCCGREMTGVHQLAQSRGLELGLL